MGKKPAIRYTYMYIIYSVCKIIQILQATDKRVRGFTVSASVSNSNMFLYEWYGSEYFLKYRSENTGDNSCKD